MAAGNFAFSLFNFVFSLLLLVLTVCGFRSITLNCAAVELHTVTKVKDSVSFRLKKSLMVIISYLFLFMSLCMYNSIILKFLSLKQK